MSHPRDEAVALLDDAWRNVTAAGVARGSGIPLPDGLPANRPDHSTVSGGPNRPVGRAEATARGRRGAVSRPAARHGGVGRPARQWGQPAGLNRTLASLPRAAT